MKPYSISALITLAIFAAYWAFCIGDALIREFGIKITYIDIGALFTLGLISGVSLELAYKLKMDQKA